VHSQYAHRTHHTYNENKTSILCFYCMYVEQKNIRKERSRFWPLLGNIHNIVSESCWNVMAHGDAREGKWRGNWRMEWVASTLHIALEHGVSSITTADAHTSAASSRLNYLNGLAPFAERRNLVSARVPSHFKRSLTAFRRTEIPPTSRPSSPKRVQCFTDNLKTLPKRRYLFTTCLSTTFQKT
jgi:hypothetical protein